MYGDEAHSWKRSLSEPCLATPERSKRRRCSRSSEDVNTDVEETPVLEVTQLSPDPRDLVQVTLDHICELQRKLRHDEATGSDHDADVEYDSEDEDDDDDAIAGASSDRDVVLAGFEFCTKEALKFLVEQEQLGPHHPVVRQLTAHLQERKRQLPF